MFSNYYIVMTLFFIGCVISMRLGWLLGIRFASNQFTKERVAEVEKEIREKYYTRLEEEFKKAVEKRAREIVDECFTQIKEQEKENDNESISSD